MTPVNRSAPQRAASSSLRETRIHLIAEGVVASYIHDISTGTGLGIPSATARVGELLRARREGEGVPAHATR